MKTLRKPVLFVMTLIVGGVLSCSKTPPPVVEEDPVDKPVGLTARQMSNGSMQLNWKSNPLSSGYEIEVTVQGEEEGRIYEMKTNYYSVPKSDLDYATTYTWAVRTIIDKRQSEWTYSSFLTKAKPEYEDYLGTWLANPEDIDIQARIMSYEMNLSELMPEQEGAGGSMKFLVSESFDKDDNLIEDQVVLEMPDAAAYFPVNVDVLQQKFILKALSNQTLSGQFNGGAPVVREFDPPVALSDIEGLSELIGGESIPIDLGSIVIESISIQVTSINITATFPDAQDHSKAHFKISMNAVFSIKTTDGMLESILALIAPGSTSMMIVAEIDCEKQP